MVLIDSDVITAIDHTLGPSLFLDFLISFSFAWNRIILSRILPHMSAGLETLSWPVLRLRYLLQLLTQKPSRPLT